MLISIAIPSLEVDVLKGEWSHALANKDGTARLLSVKTDALLVAVTVPVTVSGYRSTPHRASPRFAAHAAA